MMMHMHRLPWLLLIGIRGIDCQETVCGCRYLPHVGLVYPRLRKMENNVQ